jgi:hypothetical protein
VLNVVHSQRSVVIGSHLSRSHIIVVLHVPSYNHFALLVHMYHWFWASILHGVSPVLSHVILISHVTSRTILFYLSEWMSFRPHSIITCIGGPYSEKGQLPLNIDTWRLPSFWGIQSNHWTNELTGWKVTLAVWWETVTSHWVKWNNHQKEKPHGKQGRPSTFQWSRCSILLVFWHQVILHHFLVLPLPS